MTSLGSETEPRPTRSRVGPRHPLVWIPEVLIVAGIGLLAGCTGRSARTAQSPAGLSPKREMLAYTAWAQSKHGATQTDVAGELAASHPGEAPNAVVHSEDCIACHSPLAVLSNGGMSEGQALGYFFTTKSGSFTGSTAPANTVNWPNVGCETCHDTLQGSPPGPNNIAYFDSATASYQKVANADQLCGECHGSLRFPDTDHLSYNIQQGTGGIGIADYRSMPGIPCTSCHMYASNVGGSNSAQFAGHTFAVSVTEPNGQVTSSCSQSGCHGTWTGAQSQAIIASEVAEYQALDSIASKDVAQAAAAMKGVTDPGLKSKLAEAEHNLTYAESDESGGFHNHTYLMQLLTDANSKAQEILAALKA